MQFISFKIPNIFIKILMYLQKRFFKHKSKDIGLLDGDLTNVMYRSKRSRIHYLYLSNTLAHLVNFSLMIYLYFKTGINFFSTINTRCLPINYYYPGDSIKLHRDRDMFTNETIKHVLVITLYNEKTNIFELHNNVIVSNNGKTVESNSSATLIPTYKGQAILFDNTSTAHAVKCTGTRISLTYRSK